MNTALPDGKMEYVLYGAENQSEIHYAMAVRNNLYDALEYAGQVEEAAGSHRKEIRRRKEQGGRCDRSNYKFGNKIGSGANASDFVFRRDALQLETRMEVDKRSRDIYNESAQFFAVMNKHWIGGYYEHTG